MNINDFFQQFVDGYLLGDLESMSHITVPAGKTAGGVGYPMVATVLAGMELLGQLLMPNTDTYNRNAGSIYFLNYWDHYFSQKYPEYTGLGKLFRQLMRNGIAHNFVAKPGIFVEKGSNRQMSIDRTTQEIYIDCNVFFKEFEDSYKTLVQPILDGTTTDSMTSKITMQTRLDNLSVAYSDDSTKLFTTLPPLNVTTHITNLRAQVPVSPLFSTLGVRASGASGAMPPGPTETMGAVTMIDIPSIDTRATATIQPSSVSLSGTISSNPKTY